MFHSNLAVLQELGPAFTGGEFCVVSLEADPAPYMRSLFCSLFLLPAAACLGLMGRVCSLQ